MERILYRKCFNYSKYFCGKQRGFDMAHFAAKRSHFYIHTAALLNITPKHDMLKISFFAQTLQSLCLRERISFTSTSDSNIILFHNHLVCKQALNHFPKLTWTCCQLNFRYDVCIDVRLVLLEIWTGCQIDPLSPKNLPSKSPGSLGLNVSLIAPYVNCLFFVWWWQKVCGGLAAFDRLRLRVWSSNQISLWTGLLFLRDSFIHLELLWAYHIVRM